MHRYIVPNTFVRTGSNTARLDSSAAVSIHTFGRTTLYVNERECISQGARMAAIALPCTIGGSLVYMQLIVPDCLDHVNICEMNHLKNYNYT